MRWVIAVLVVCAPRVVAAETYPGYLGMIPLDGTTSDDTLDANPDAVPDPGGIGLGGATSNELRYSVDDAPTDGVVFGGDALPVPIELIDELTVDPGRGTVQVTTPTPDDTWQSSAFGMIEPWSARVIGSDLGVIRATTSPTASAHIGGQAGGPIVKDELWVWGGVVATGGLDEIDRRVVRYSDDEVLDDRTIGTHDGSVFAIGKLEAAPKDRVKVGLEAIAAPTRATGVDPYGWVDQLRTESRTLGTETILHGSIEEAHGKITAAICLHRESTHESGRDQPLVENVGDLGTLAQLGGEEPGVIDGCANGACGLVDYRRGGPGPLTDRIAQRAWAHFAASRTIGAHEIAVTIDVDGTRMSAAHHLSGGDEMVFGTTVGETPVTHASSRAMTGEIADTWQPKRDLLVLAHLGYQAQRSGDLALAAWTPDLAITYDPSHDARAELYAAWYRRMERIPLDVAASGQAIDPTLAPQVTESFVAGARRAFDGDLVIGVHVLVSHLVHAIEDAGGEITNPPDARRLHSAFVVAAEHRFEGGFGLLASYTFAHTTGTDPGLLDGSTGQIDPNLLEAFDTPSGNEQGPLPQERVHTLAIDAAWAPGHGFHAGMHWRARSGMPIDVYAQPNGEEFLLLPRGAGGRTPWFTDVNVRVGYTRRRFTIDLDVLHTGATQDVLRVDPIHGSATAPIVGGTLADLPASGATRLASYGAPTARVAPIAFRLAARYDF